VGIGMGMVVPELAKPGTPVQIEIRGKLYPAVVVSKPFYASSRICVGDFRPFWGGASS